MFGLFFLQKPQATTRSTAAPRRLANGVNAHKIKKNTLIHFYFQKLEGGWCAGRQRRARAAAHMQKIEKQWQQRSRSKQENM
jgi:hypothetical protein